MEIPITTAEFATPETLGAIETLADRVLGIAGTIESDPGMKTCYCVR